MGPPGVIAGWQSGAVGMLRNAGPESFEEFGRRYFVLPNPMYGSWARNDWR